MNRISTDRAFHLVFLCRLRYMVHRSWFPSNLDNKTRKELDNLLAKCKVSYWLEIRCKDTLVFLTIMEKSDFMNLRIGASHPLGKGWGQDWWRHMGRAKRVEPLSLRYVFIKTFTTKFSIVSDSVKPSKPTGNMLGFRVSALKSQSGFIINNCLNFTWYRKWKFLRKTVWTPFCQFIDAISLQVKLLMN